MNTPGAFLGCALLPALLAAAAAAPLPAPSTITTITAVTVYADRAVVTRTAALDLAAAGPAEVTFEKLPAALVDQSLTVAGHGAAQVAILDVTARAAYVDFTPNERVKVIEDELRGLAKQFRMLSDRGATLNEEHDFVKRMLTASTGQIIYPLGAAPERGGGTPARPTLDEWQKLYTYSEETLGKIAAEMQSLDQQREDLTAKKSALEHQLNELRGAGGRSFKTVTVRLNTVTTGTLELALSYAVPGASWTPSYDARVNSTEKTIALAYSGVVRQNTGEDWKDVALTLSTAHPSLGGAAPALTPWALDVFVPRPVPVASEAVKLAAFEASAARRPNNFGAGNTMNMRAFSSNAPLDAEARAEKQDAGFAAATIDSAATSASFKVTAPASVPSDNSPQKVPVTTAALAANPEYLTTPKLQPAAFLTAKVVNSSEFPLLAGAMSVFLDGTFVATSALRTVMPGEKFDLALGADEGIAVKHKRVTRFTEDTGLTNSGKRVTYEYLLTIQNNKKTAARVIVADTLPVSRNEKIVVKQLAPDAKDVKPTPEGALKWTLDLKPAEKRELTLKFSVDYPNDVQVTGLEP